MSIKIIPSKSFFRMPFTLNTKVLTEYTLNRHSEFRKPKRGFFPIKVRKLSFINELLTIGVTLDQEDEELVYIKVTASALLVSCSVDTHEGYLSRYAYFSLCQLMYYKEEYDFEEYYWPGFFDDQTGVSKYLKIHKWNGNLHVSAKARYKYLYKPDKHLPQISKDMVFRKEAISVVKEDPAENSSLVLGFCLAACNNERYTTNHFSFLIPYIAMLNKDKTQVKSFTAYVLNEMQLSEIDLTVEQQALLDICFDMKKIALIKGPVYRESEVERAERMEQNRDNSVKLFQLWQKAFPLLLGRLCTHYTFSFGMRNLKGKPRRTSMMPCSFDKGMPEICFLWKDMGEYYKLELRLLLHGAIHQMRYFNYGNFFAMKSYDPRIYALLNSIRDSDLFTFFQERHFQLSVLKKHYDGDFKNFVESLKAVYRFIYR